METWFPVVLQVVLVVMTLHLGLSIVNIPGQWGCLGFKDH